MVSDFQRQVSSQKVESQGLRDNNGSQDWQRFRAQGKEKQLNPMKSADKLQSFEKVPKSGPKKNSEKVGKTSGGGYSAKLINKNSMASQNQEDEEQPRAYSFKSPEPASD